MLLAWTPTGYCSQIKTYSAPHARTLKLKTSRRAREDLWTTGESLASDWASDTHAAVDSERQNFASSWIRGSFEDGQSCQIKLTYLASVKLSLGGTNTVSMGLTKFYPSESTAARLGISGVAVSLFSLQSRDSVSSISRKTLQQVLQKCCKRQWHRAERHTNLFIRHYWVIWIPLEGKPP